MRSTTWTGTTDAPVTDSRSEDRSKVAKSGWDRMDWNTDGGPGSIVTRSRATVAMTAATSKTAWGSRVALVKAQASTPDLRPAVWKNGYTHR